MRLIVEMKRSMLPTEDYCDSARMTMDAMVDWRNRLKDGLSLPGEARAIWIADSLGLVGFNYPD